MENASLLPWLLGTALLHALVVCEKRGAYGHAVLLLSIFTFSLSLLGTFVVRSGCSPRCTPLRWTPAAASHPLVAARFAVDLRPHPVCPAGGHSRPYARFGLLVKRGLLGAAILLLSVACASVLLGTFYPMVFQSLHLGSLSVGAPISIPSSCRWPSA